MSQRKRMGRLKHFNLHYLERRTIKEDLARLGDVNRTLGVRKQGRTRSYELKLDVFSFNKDIGNNELTNRLVDDLKRLGSHVVSVRTIAVFSERLDGL